MGDVMMNEKVQQTRAERQDATQSFALKVDVLKGQIETAANGWLGLAAFMLTVCLIASGVALGWWGLPFALPK